MSYRTLLNMFLAFSCSFLVIVVICNIYSKNHQQAVLIIEADAREIKIKPVERGGITILHAGSVIYEHLKDQHQQPIKTITLLPEPEQPLELGILKDASDTKSLIDEMLAVIFACKQDNDSAQRLSPAVNQGIFAKELQVLPAWQVINPANLQTLNSPVLNSNPQLKSALTIIKVKHGSKVDKVTTPSKVLKNYKIQLDTVKSAHLGLVRGEEIKRKHQKILGTTNISLKQVQHANGLFFYLVLAGDYPTLSKAKIACKQLVARQQSCLIFTP